MPSTASWNMIVQTLIYRYLFDAQTEQYIIEHLEKTKKLSGFKEL